MPIHLRKTILLCIFYVTFYAEPQIITTAEKPKKYTLSACAVFKNEAKYLKEWIEFHRLIGVDHFYLYNIGSTDRYMDVLRKYIKDKVVTLIHWPDLSKKQDDQMSALAAQIPAYENAIKYLTPHETKWLVFIDVNEFLLPIDGNTLDEMTKKYEDYPGIVLSRQFFDASCFDHLPKRNLIIESIEMTKPPKLNPYKTIEKVIFKPSLCTVFTWPPYHFIFKDNQLPITLNKKEMRINSYVYRHIGSLQARGVKGIMSMDHQLAEYELNQLLEDGYQVQDHSIDRFIAPLRKKMGY